MRWQSRSAAALSALSVTSALACSPTVRDLSPVGEVLVVVDTDMPVPTVINRLRIDLYTPDGSWFESRDVARSKKADWPTSFGVFLPDPAREGSVVVRLRAYLDGEVRDYRGERYVVPKSNAKPFEIAQPAGPAVDTRLLRTDGSDGTPKSEPEPATTIDRLLLVRVRPDVHAGVHVVLRGACVGTMADLAGRQSCTDTGMIVAPIAEEPTTGDTSLETPSLAGTFGTTERCTAKVRAPHSSADGTPLHDDEVCVDGAMFVYGSKDAFGLGEADDVPRRVAIVPPFRIDRYELTVARFRDAIARGFVVPNGPGLPLSTNNAALPTVGTDPNSASLCTWSDAPLGRETFPLNCISWSLARAFCKFDGGDLPSEAQWEYVAANAGRPFQSRYPWGGDDRTVVRCDQTVFGRGPFPFDNECNLDGSTFGLLPVGSRTDVGADVSAGLGVVDLAGGLSEFTVDAFASLSSNCWASQPLVAPACLVEPAPSHTARGGNWSTSRQSFFVAFRTPFSSAGGSTGVGVRCVHPGQ